MKTAVALLTVFIALPIWFFLVYKILVTINASELMWFLFWIYVPVSLVISVAGRYISLEEKK